MTDTPDFTTFRLGESTETLLLQGMEDEKQVASLLMSQATRNACLFSRDLDPRLYDQQAFLDAVQALALHSQNSEIRILVQDNQRVVKQGHRLIELARRLTSRILIRRVHSDYLDRPENFLIVDDRGFLHWRISTLPEATAGFNHPLQVKQYRLLFDEIWGLSEPDPEMRGLYI